LSILLRAMPVKHGKHRMLDRIAPEVWDKSGRHVIRSIHNREAIVDPHDLVGWHLAILGSFDPEIVEILERACDPRIREVFWDIGANKGACFCSLAARLPSLQVVAIEPQSSLSTNNLMNLETICPGRYEYVRAGIGEEEAELVLTIPGSNLGRASLHLRPSGPHDRQETIKIRTATQVADNSRFGWPTIAKIDVEGHEPQVFGSLAPCIEARTCKVIVFENHASESGAFEAVRSATQPHGYDIYGIRKSPWSTRLMPTEKQLHHVTDYAVIRRDQAVGNRKIAEIIRKQS